VAVTGTQKAALLLMSLEPSTAAELLKSATPTMITKIAAELASMDETQYGRSAAEGPVREFHGLLSKVGGDAGPMDFMRQMLESTVGKQNIVRALGDVDHMIQLRDPFRPLRDASTSKLGEALKGESAQVAAMILGELPARKSAALLPLLDEDIRVMAVQGIASNQVVAPEAKLRVAAAIQARLQVDEIQADEQPAAVEPEGSEDERYRKVALLLRGLKAELSDELMENMAASDAETAAKIKRMMVMWEDLAIITDRSLQEALRSVDSRRLALSLINAEPHLVDRIRNNISERANSMLDEEASLLANSKDEDIELAREAILDSLRELNSDGELDFEED